MFWIFRFEMSFWTFQFFRRIVYHRDIEQAQRRAAGDRSGRIFSEKYVLMSKNTSMTFGSLGSLLPFSKSPPKLIKKYKFSKMIFLLFSFVTLSLLAKNYVSITKIVNFGPLGPFCPFWKGPQTHRKRFVLSNLRFVSFFCHIEPTCQKLCIYFII